MINEVLVPRINSNDDQVQIVRWHIKSGEYVSKGAVLVDVETSKTVVSVEADFAGYLDGAHDVGKIVQVGSILCYLKDEADELVDAAESKSSRLNGMNKIGEHKFAKLETESDNRLWGLVDSSENSDQKVFTTTRFSKAAIKLIREMGLNTESYAGKGLVTSSSILKSAEPQSRNFRGAEIVVENNPIQQKGPIVPREETLPLSKRSEITQLTIGEQGLINSSLSICFDSAAIRSAVNTNTIFANFQALLLYEIAQLLPQWPQFTAYYEADQIHFYSRVDLGIAIDLGMGLKVVRIKDIENLSISEISEITLDYCLRYMRNEIQVDELVGSTITVTDLSSQDILYFHPLINGYQSAIIGIGGDSSRPEHPMAINMTFDHRVTTGREVAIFLKELKERILSYKDIVSHI